MKLDRHFMGISAEAVLGKDLQSRFKVFRMSSALLLSGGQWDGLPVLEGAVWDLMECMQMNFLEELHSVNCCFASLQLWLCM